MNTHDIELPPLPPLCIAPSVEPVDYPKVAQALMDYARTAVEADRQQRESIVTDDMRSAIRFAPFSAYWSDVLRDIFGPDAREGIDALERRRGVGCARQRRGSIVNNAPASSEPVAWGAFYFGGKREGKLYNHTETEAQIDAYITDVHRSNDSITLRKGPLYTAPQPAEPMVINAIFETEEGEVIGTTEAKVKRYELQDDGSITVVIDYWPQPDDPDSAKCAECGAELIHVRPGKWQHPDCSQSSWAADIVSKTDWNNELSSWSDEDFIRIFHERPDLANRLRKMLAEPVESWHDFAPRQHQNPDKFTMPVNMVDKSTHMWKRIEDYSREVDGKKIDIYLGDFLLYCPELEDEENSGVVIGYYSEPYKGWYTSETLEEVFPTHFMPLPEKP